MIPIFGMVFLIEAFDDSKPEPGNLKEWIELSAKS